MLRFALGRRQIPAVLRNGPPDARDSLRCLRPRAQSTVQPAAPVRHRRTLARHSLPILCTTSRRLEKIARRIAVLDPGGRSPFRGGGSGCAPACCMWLGARRARGSRDRGAGDAQRERQACFCASRDNRAAGGAQRDGPTCFVRPARPESLRRPAPRFSATRRRCRKHAGWRTGPVVASEGLRLGTPDGRPQGRGPPTDLHQRASDSRRIHERSTEEMATWPKLLTANCFPSPDPA
jgi:hypothetical protein